MALKELLGKALARFEHGGGARGTKDAQAALAEGVDNAEGERQLRADDGEGGLLGLGEADHGVEVFEIDGNAAGDLGHAAVAGRANDFRDARAARNGPGQRMFAASRTKDQDFHGAKPFARTNVAMRIADPEKLWSAMRAGEVKRDVTKSKRRRSPILMPDARKSAARRSLREEHDGRDPHQAV